MVVAMVKERRPIAAPLAVLGLTDAALADATAKLLRADGWQVMVAETAADVRRASARLRPEVVILDVDPPDESGWLTCAKLQRLRSRPRVILVDADPAPTRDEFAQFVGAVARVAMPVSASDLAAMVNEVEAVAV
jgi:DNA-binding response OmpR family regulator